MSLLNAIKIAPKPLAVDYNYLDANATTVLKGKLAKRKASFADKVVLNIGDKADLNSCDRLSKILKLSGGILFNPPGKKNLLKMNDVNVVAFRSALLLFDLDNPAKKIMDEFTTNPSDGTFTFLSGQFIQKHFADGDVDAETKASERYVLNNEIKVSSFLYAGDIVKFDKEVLACNPLFKKLLERVRTKEAAYRMRNKRIDDLVICSSETYNKVQCTQNSAFKPNFYPPEFMYYSIATPTANPNVICDHYVAKSTLFEKDALKPGWRELNYKKFAATTDLPPFDIKIYVKYGTFED